MSSTPNARAPSTCLEGSFGLQPLRQALPGGGRRFYKGFGVQGFRYRFTFAKPEP